MIGDSRPHEPEEFEDIVADYSDVTVEFWTDAVDDLINKKVK